jgi:type II secretion system protein C
MKFRFNILIYAFFIISVSYLAATIVFMFLKPLPNYHYPFKKDIFFFDISLENKLFLPPKKKPVKKEINYIKDFKLIGIYSEGKKGFVIIQDKSKNVFIDLNTEYKGYKLVKININSAVFEKNGQKYILTLTKEKKQSIKENSNTHISHPKKLLTKIQRKLIKFYKRNLIFVWQNIGLTQVKNGYKITYIKPGSVFERLGLKKSDILVEVNGRKLSSDSDAWNLYNNVNKFDEVRVKILRNNQEKVLKYEIY